MLTAAGYQSTHRGGGRRGYSGCLLAPSLGMRPCVASQTALPAAPASSRTWERRGTALAPTLPPPYPAGRGQIERAKFHRTTNIRGPSLQKCGDSEIPRYEGRRSLFPIVAVHHKESGAEGALANLLPDLILVGRILQSTAHLLTYLVIGLPSYVQYEEARIPRLQPLLFIPVCVHVGRTARRH
jgi:hypothetical protein